MNSVTLDIRLRIQLLAPRDPREHWTSEQKADDAAFKAAQLTYNKAITQLLNDAITMWDPDKHSSMASIRNSENASRGLGSKHAKKGDDGDGTDAAGDVGSFLQGETGAAKLKSKARMGQTMSTNAASSRLKSWRTGFLS